MWKQTIPYCQYWSFILEYYPSNVQLIRGSNTTWQCVLFQKRTHTSRKIVCYHRQYRKGRSLKILQNGSWNLCLKLFDRAITFAFPSQQNDNTDGDSDINDLIPTLLNTFACFRFAQIQFHSLWNPTINACNGIETANYRRSVISD